ncbi:hypothetical protein HDU80_005227 [Chytriomyces hyalinus]|nr:hypothetical protein HDU80_005227 [Chytriomyces hyalinus]
MDGGDDRISRTPTGYFSAIRSSTVRSEASNAQSSPARSSSMGSYNNGSGSSYAPTPATNYAPSYDYNPGMTSHPPQRTNSHGSATGEFYAQSSSSGNYSFVADPYGGHSQPDPSRSMHHQQQQNYPHAHYQNQQPEYGSQYAPADYGYPPDLSNSQSPQTSYSNAPPPSQNMDRNSHHLQMNSHSSPRRSKSQSRPPIPGHPRNPPTPKGPSLFDQGIQFMTPGVALSPMQAFEKFDLCLRRAEPPNSPSYNWYYHATCLNNMAVAKRQCSRFEEAITLIQEAWTVTIHALVAEKFKLNAMGMDLGSDWMELVVSLLSLDSSAQWITYMEELQNQPVEYHASGHLFPHRSDSVGSQSQYETEATKVLHGPPIVVLFFDLTTNLGNILFNLGLYEEAISQHSNCLRLAETVFEYFPLDADFRMSFPLSIAARFKTSMAGGRPDLRPSKSNSDSSTPAADSSSTHSGAAAGNPLHDPNMPTPPRNRRLHLSYLHRSTILAQSRSLTHLAVCCQSLGLDDAALQCNSHALEIISFYGRVGIIGGVKEGTEAKSGYALARYWTTVKEKGEDAVVRQKSQKRLSRDEQMKWQEEQTKHMDVYKKDAMDPLKACIMGNTAVSFYAKGRFSSSMEQMVESSAIFQSLHCTSMQTRALSSIHALKLEIARTLKSLHWLRNMESQAIGASEMEECTRYWGPPRLRGISMEGASDAPDMFAPESVGANWAVSGLTGLKQCLTIFKEKNDLVGMLYTLVNIASGYIINGHPYVALYILGTLLTEETSSGESIASQAAASGNSAKIPESLRLHVHFTVCQAVFLLLRLQQSPTQDLFPQFLEIDPKNDTLLCCFAEPITALLEALDLQIYNFMDLEVLAVGFVTAVQGLERTREDIVNQVPYSMLYPYIGGQDAYFGATARFLNAQSLGSSENMRSDVNSTDYLFGIGTGIDFYTQQSILIRILMGKNDWLNASDAYKYEHERSIHFYTEGAKKLDATVTEALDIFRVDSREITSRSGLISAMHEGSLAALMIPPVGPMTDADTSANDSVKRFAAAMQSSAFTAPTMFAISADVMASGAYQMQTRGQQSNAANAFSNLLAVLGIPATPTPARVHRDLLGASVAAFSGGYGMCEACMRNVLQDSDSYGELVFIGADGSSVGMRLFDGQAVQVFAGQPGATVAATRASAEVNGKFMFPCAHYIFQRQ